ncbi:MAG: CHASE2 domain-containing protein [Cyanobacteria bacterium P01_F01_bin.150]
MSQRVVLNLGRGSLHQGFPSITAQVWELHQAKPIQAIGELPPNPALASLFQQWRSYYDALASRLHWRRTRMGLEIDPEDEITTVSAGEFNTLCAQLERDINAWLDSELFSRIDRRLRNKLQPDHTVQMIIEVDDETLRQFPWQLWHFLDDFPRTEVALGTQDFERVPTALLRPKKRMRILAILGNSQGINLEEDRRLLEQFPRAEIHFLVEPGRKAVDKALWDDQGWDVLFFAGHSESQQERTTGRIEINPADGLTIPQLKNALKAAMIRGLKLAIFNSCDGLGLAQDLADLHIPQLIVMRAPVPDQVAHEFLKSFLTLFARGESFYLAVREARSRLQGLEDQFPCASWLPVICQNPAVEPLTWDMLLGKPSSTDPLPSQPSRLAVSGLMMMMTGIVVASLTLVVQHLGVLEQSELTVFDQLMQRRPQTEGVDPRLLLVTVTEADVQDQEERLTFRGSLSNDALNQLLETLAPYEPAVVGVDIYRLETASPERHPTLSNYLNANDQFVTICGVGESTSLESESDIAPPPEISGEQIRLRVGFSDIVLDLDNVIRRQLFQMGANTSSRCQATNSFAFLMAAYYLSGLDPGNFRVNLNEKNDSFYLGGVKLPTLRNHYGAYQTADDDGYQTMLNYRRTESIAPRLTLAEALEGEAFRKNPELVNGNIVLIGTVAESYNDFHDIPHRGDLHEIPGVELQAHMISQLISAVLDGRPLIWWWPRWGEVCWLMGWSLLGAATAWQLSRWQLILLIDGISVVVLYVFCYVALVLSGVWVSLLPPSIGLLVSSGAIASLKALPDDIPSRLKQRSSGRL